jgi:hypothetical protein
VALRESGGCPGDRPRVCPYSFTSKIWLICSLFLPRIMHASLAAVTCESETSEAAASQRRALAGSQAPGSQAARQPSAQQGTCVEQGLDVHVVGREDDREQHILVHVLRALWVRHVRVQAAEDRK